MRNVQMVKLVLLVLLVLSVAGCYVEIDPPWLTGNVELNNRSDATIDAFYLATTDQSSWGSNLLGRLVYPDDYVVFSYITPNNYDAMIRATGFFSTYYAYAYNLPVRSNLTIVLNVYNSSFSGSMEIFNQTATASIIAIYVVPADATDWGENQIFHSVGPGGTLEILDLDPGVYDIRIVWSFGPDSFFYDVDIESLVVTTLNAD